jgi:signal transduction histidine kinase/ActR/RegA family two-component response regulator
MPMLISRAREFYERAGTLRKSRTAGYAVALATVAVALLARFMLAGDVAGFPFLTFIPAILLTSFFCGWRAGALAGALGALARLYFFSAVPTAGPSPGQVSLWVGYSMYVFAVAIILMAVGSMHAAFEDLAASAEQRKLLNAELETRVHERTQALETANRSLLDEAASRAAAEAQIRQLQKMEAVGQLTGGIAHDFNNMLAIVVGSLDIAKRCLTSDPRKAERFIGNAIEGARRGAQLTSRLLAFSRQQSLDPRPLDVNHLVRDMSDLLVRSIGSGIALKTALDSAIWRTFADASQLESALINLCVNSRDAMPDGGELSVATLNATLSDADVNQDAQPGDYVCICVTDTGAGMEPHVLARAFDPFFTTKTPGKGTGLGLSQIYGFVKQSEGHVRIDSQPGRGTTVRIYLPRYLGEERPTPKSAPRVPQASRPNRETVLVVEDEDGVRAVTVEALAGLGYTVIAATGPEHALELLNQGAQADLLFTDVVMPGMDGRALAHRVKDKCPDIKVLFTTGYIPGAPLYDVIAASGAALLPKPFTVEQLAAQIRGTLDLRSETPVAH